MRQIHFTKYIVLFIELKKENDKMKIGLDSVNSKWEATCKDLLMVVDGQACELKETQLQILQTLADTISDASHLVVLHHFNLLTNARDAINLKNNPPAESDNRFIEIHSYREGDQVAVTVSAAPSGLAATAADNEVRTTAAIRKLSISTLFIT